MKGIKKLYLSFANFWKVSGIILVSACLILFMSSIYPVQAEEAWFTDNIYCQEYPQMFEHRDLEGRRVEIRQSYNDLRDISFNNAAGSICIPYGFNLAVYVRPDFQLSGNENRNNTTFRIYQVQEAARVNSPNHLPIAFNLKGTGINNRISSVYFVEYD